MKTKTKKLSFFYKKVCDKFYISQNIHFIEQIDVDIKDPMYINVPNEIDIKDPMYINVPNEIDITDPMYINALFDVNSVEERLILF